MVMVVAMAGYCVERARDKTSSAQAITEQK